MPTVLIPESLDFHPNPPPRNVTWIRTLSRAWFPARAQLRSVRPVGFWVGAHFPPEDVFGRAALAQQSEALARRIVLEHCLYFAAGYLDGLAAPDRFPPGVEDRLQHPAGLAPADETLLVND